MHTHQHTVDTIGAHLLQLTSCLCVFHLLLCYCSPNFYSITMSLFIRLSLSLSDVEVSHTARETSWPSRRRCAHSVHSSHFTLDPILVLRVTRNKGEQGALLLLHQTGVHHLLPISCAAPHILLLTLYQYLGTPSNQPVCCLSFFFPSVK